MKRGLNMKQLYELAENQFSKRGSLMSMWQEISDHFYVERADFTTQRELGSQYAGNLTTSYPLMCRRDFGDQVGTMLRPAGKAWNHIVTRDPRRVDNEGRRWLEWATEVMRRAMYDKDARFTRAAKEADHDFATFGQAVMSIELNRHQDALLFRTWHLRDVAWVENEDGGLGAVFRRWAPDARTVARLWPKTVHPMVLQEESKSPFAEQKLMHMVVESDLYDGPAGRHPRWSIWYDCRHEHVLEATPIAGRHYIIPRWLTVSAPRWGSQYAFSPATVCALPDARLIQSMAVTLLEAGEKATNPPMVATENVVRSDIAIYAGGVTWVDADYDERLGEALRPITQDLRGLATGRELMNDTREMILRAFYLNKLTLPQRGPDMTAYEVGQRIQEYIRGALPLFEPMEMEYNGALCEETFELLMRAGAFGGPDMVPRSLRGADTDFEFESPLHDAIEAQKGQQFLQAKEMVGVAMAIDPEAVFVVDVKTALREALDGVGVPAAWQRPEVEADQMAEQQKQAAQQAQMAEQLKVGSEAAANLAQAQVSQAELAPA